MIWLALLLPLLYFLQASGLECYHMNKYGESKLVNCRGYCASISAVVATNNLAEVNYCVPERRCIAELDSRQLADMGMQICRGLIDNAQPGAIARCKAAVCQSDGCNNYNFRSNPRLNDCRIHQCMNAACHNPEERLSTMAPPISLTYLTKTPRFTTPPNSTEPSVHTTPRKEVVVFETEPSVHTTPRKEVVDFETEPTATDQTTTTHNKVTTKAAEGTTIEETTESDQTTKSGTDPEVSPSTEADHTTKDETEKPTTEAEQPTTEAEQPTTSETGTPSPTTEESLTTVEEKPTTPEEEVYVTTASHQPTLELFETLTPGGPLLPTETESESSALPTETESGSSALPSASARTTDSVDGSHTTDTELETTLFVLVTEAETGPEETEENRTTEPEQTEQTTPSRSTSTSTKFGNYIGSTGPADRNNEYNQGFISDNTLEISDRRAVQAKDNNNDGFRYYLSLSLLISVICFVVL